MTSSCPLRRGEPVPSTAFNDRSTIGQNGYGSALELTVLRRLAGLENQLAVGAAADLRDVDFTQQGTATAWATRCSCGAEIASPGFPHTR